MTTNNRQSTIKYCKQKQHRPLANSNAAFQSHGSKYLLQNRKFLARENTSTRTYDTWTNFTYEKNRLSDISRNEQEQLKTVWNDWRFGSLVPTKLSCSKTAL